MNNPEIALGSSRVLRREFMLLSAGAAVALDGAAVAAAESTSVPMRPLRPRYYRWHVDPGVEWVESNTGYAHLDWTIPVDQAALVLVDVWDRHYLQDTQARADEIIDTRFVPLLERSRQAGLTIIHAPSPPQAETHPNWVGAGRQRDRTVPASDWPPAAFRSKSGTYADYRRPAEPRAAELQRLRSSLRIHPKVQPSGSEPVIATGDELHELCRAQGILFLFFAGFNTNACILVRDYGTLAMSQRGYEVILLRDCTTGMEARWSQSTLGQTNGAILLLEMFGQYSITSDELLTSLTLS